MTSGTSIGFLTLMLAVGLSACESIGSTSLTAPSAVQQPVVVPPSAGSFPPGVLNAYTLSGVVFEVLATSPTPIEGVWVYCELCGAETHSWSLTDSNGVYSFTGVWTTPGVRTPLWFSKEGYTDPPGVPSVFSGFGWRLLLVNGDTRLDVQLVRK